MKITEGLKIIENGWIRKPKGFRVKFQKRTETGMEEAYSPPEEAAPLNSDVTAWRYAWKLWQATQDIGETVSPGTLYNITVVDDLGNPFRFYGTGKIEIYNPKDVFENGVPATNDNGT